MFSGCCRCCDGNQRMFVCWCERFQVETDSQTDRQSERASEREEKPVLILLIHHTKAPHTAFAFSCSTGWLAGWHHLFSSTIERTSRASRTRYTKTHTGRVCNRCLLSSFVCQGQPPGRSSLKTSSSWLSLSSMKQVNEVNYS